MNTSLERLIKKYRKKAFLKKFSSTFPKLAYYTIYLPISYFRYKNERNLEKGISVSQSGHPSIILFTIQKCASTLVTKILKELSENSNLVHIDFDSYFTTVSPEKYKLFNDKVFQQKSMKSRGYYYGAWRHFRKIEKIDDYKVLLILRDPRDVLTSMYFSSAFSHSPVSKSMVSNRPKVTKLSIDEFVLTKASYICRIYTEYIENLISNPSVLFLRYEDMVSDFSIWLDRLTTHVKLNHETEAIETFKKTISFKVKKEDKHSHIRNIQPGDHKQKLKHSTIIQLNELFKDILKPLSYEN